MTENNEIQSTHVRVAIEYQMVGDLPGKEWANLVLNHAKNEGLIEGFAVQGVHPTYFAVGVDFTIDLPIGPYAEMDYKAAKEAVRPIAEKIVGESDLEVRYVYPVVVADASAGAAFGQGWLVRAQYNTEADGTPVDESVEGEYPTTLHGPFDTEEEGVDWMNDFAPDDTDIHEVDLITFNRVK